jgi:hypothetical protein
LLPQRRTRFLRLGLHEFACAAPVQQRPLRRLSCIAAMASTAIDRELRQAIFRGDLDAARRCLDEGASTAGVFRFIRRADGVDDENEETVLTLAVQAMCPPRPFNASHGVENPEMLALLLDHGADVSLEGCYGKPLVIACEAGLVDAARLLLDRGAAVNGFNTEGWTPAEAAACGNRVDVLELLLARGASLDLIPRPWDAAEYYRETGTPFGVACIFGSVEAATLLLERGSDVEGLDSRGATPLMNALFNGQPRSVRLLLSRGADVERPVRVDCPMVRSCSFCDWTSIAPVALARGRRCAVLQYDPRAAHVNAAFDTFFLARFLVAGRRTEHQNLVARCSVLHNRDLVKVIATFLILKTPMPDGLV